MQFLYALSPATWLKIAIASLLLALACLAVLMGYRINISFVAPPPKARPASPAPLAASRPSASSFLPPQTAQTNALAPERILDPYAEFKPVTEFDDTIPDTRAAIPPPVAPAGLLDPSWKGEAP